MSNPGIVFSSLLTVSLLFATAGTAPSQVKTTGAGSGEAPRTGKVLVTFVELGSVKCIPCRMMQPVMESIGKKYGDQVNIVFHDVWTDSGKILAEPYRIRAIPTQVFLGQKGNEIFRHEGFYPESEIDKLLQKHGLKVITPKTK